MVKTSELNKYYKQKEHREFPEEDDENKGSSGDESEEEEDRGISVRDRVKEIENREKGGIHSDHASDRESDRESGESGHESGREGSESEGAVASGKDRQPIPPKSGTSPAKSNEVRRSNRARVVPKRFNPLNAGQPPATNRPRVPHLPRSWGGEGASAYSSSRSRYFSQMGYDTSSSSDDDDQNLPRALPSLRMGAAIPQPINMARPHTMISRGKGLRVILFSDVNIYLADTSPLDIDKSINWNSIGGLNYRILLIIYRILSLILLRYITT